MAGNRILVCVAWPYANGALHLGHMAGSIMPADIFARYHRMIGDDVLMVSGSDMHGAPIAVRADKEGSTPEKIAFRYHEMNAKALEGIGASFNIYTHTHTENHSRTVHDVFLKLLEKGYLEKRTTPQYYCDRCQRFLPDRYVEGLCPYCSYEKARGDQCDNCGKALNADELKDAKCQLCGQSPALKETEHFFLRLTMFEDELRRFLADKAHWRERVKSFTENILEEGLQDRAITRDISWGVPVPVKGFEDKRIYVWFEAVIGYLSASKEWAAREGRPDDWRLYWEDRACRSYYFLGKDNIIFHTIIWPAILLGYGGLNLPFDVPANEFMNLGGQKFSKSAGISIDLPDMLSKFQADAIRYYLSVNMPEIKDTEFSWEDFVSKVNNELMAAYGNFVHRVLSFTYKNFGEIPGAENAPGELRTEVEKKISDSVSVYNKEISACNFKNGLKAFMELARYGNQFIDSAEPWALVRRDKEKCGAVMNLGLKIVRALAVMAYPYLPFSSREIWEYLGYEQTIEKIGISSLSSELPVGRKLLQAPKPLFKKIEIKLDEREQSDFPGLAKLNLKVGKILQVSNHPKADKLYLLTVDIGKKITIVTGLRGIYSPDELLGRNIVVVSNLEPAVFRGIKSEGMLLAAEHGDTVSIILTEKEVPPGTPVSSGYSQSDRRISFQEFQKIQMVIGQIENKTADVGQRIACMLCDDVPERKKIAFIVENGKALPLKCADGTVLLSDRDVPLGARIR
ncbi:MAG: methionine--tRNA ligase [Thermoplasmata archaeon]